jgi:hypothetical protein
MQLDTSAKKKAGTVNHQDFKAVIPVGYGEKSAQLFYCVKGQADNPACIL